ncbi:MAG: sigma-70 family RNA polymerase sigma factor [Clostridiales bacterium]|nr:sigma-70 family RNA polymerase sigma factor [Clostridiales bacterium]
MQDNEIIRLYWERNERAIEETDAAYGSYCRGISKSIVGNALDAEECVNDTYLRAWNSIPPERPSKLSLFLARITRNLSLDKVRKNNAKKRGSGEYISITEELEACLPAKDDVEKEIENEELSKTVNAFLHTLHERDSALFLLRYFYMKSVAECALRCGMSENGAKVKLHRLRAKLKTYLEKEEYKL